MRFRKSRKKREDIYNKKRPERAAQKKTLGHAKRKRRRSVVAARENSIELCSTCIVSVLNKKSKSVRRTRKNVRSMISSLWLFCCLCFSLSRRFFERFSQSLSFLSFFLSFFLFSLSLSLSLSLSFSLWHFLVRRSVYHSLIFSCVVIVLLFLFLFFSR